MLYEMIGVVRPNFPLQMVKEIVLSSGNSILQSGGVIRDVRNWGVFRLPRPATRFQMPYRKGHYFVLRYDSSPAANALVRRNLRADARVLRVGSVRLGDGRLDTLSRFGPVKWEMEM